MFTEDVVAESIGYKLRWLSKELRWINSPSGIDAWAESVRALCDLRWKIMASTAAHPEHNSNRRNGQTPSFKKTVNAISPKEAVNFWEGPSSAKDSRRNKDETKSTRIEKKRTIVKWKRLWVAKKEKAKGKKIEEDKVQNEAGKMRFGVEKESLSKDMEIDVRPEVEKGNDKGGEEEHVSSRMGDKVAVRGDANWKKVKRWWSDALWRRLKLESKDPGYWAQDNNFEELVMTCSADEILLGKFKEYYPNKPAEDSLVDSLDEELYKYLGVELDKFY